MNLIFILAVLSGVVADDFEIPPSIIYGSTTVRGAFLGFEVGDYIHPVIRDENGEIESFWSSDPLLDYFLATHVGERVVLEIEESDTYIMELGDMLRIFSVTGATFGNVSFSSWKDSLDALGEPEELLGDYFSAPYDCIYEVPDHL